VAADEVESGVELPVAEAVVSFETEVETDDVGHGAGGGEFGEGVEFGDRVAHADTIDLPGEGVAGTGVGLEMMVCGWLQGGL